MTAPRWLGAYLLAVAALGAVHHSGGLAAALAAAVLAAGPARWRLLARALRAVLVFALGLGLALAALSVWPAAGSGSLAPQALLQLNLRLLLLVYLGFWFVSRVDLRQALAPWPTLAMVATLAAGQAGVFKRTLHDFRLAFRSRNPVPAGWLDQGRHAAAQASCLLDQADAAARECALAMRSRGAFDD